MIYYYGIYFRDAQHKALYESIILSMASRDCYHKAAAYLIGLDEVLREHFHDVFSVIDDSIIADGINAAWQTDTSRKTTRLLFNLWNGLHDDNEEYTDKDGYTVPLPSPEYSIDRIFCTNYAPYYVEALKLRYPEYFSE